MEKYNSDEIYKLGICYKKYELDALFLKAGVTDVSILDILKTDLIPNQDKIYICSKILPDKLLHGFACDCAERALLRERNAGREPDKRSWEAVRIKRLWIEGKITDEEWQKARAVRAAARIAAGAAAEVAARAAARVTAWAATWTIAWEAARVAAWAAAGAEGEAERKWQVERLIELVERSGE